MADPQPPKPLSFRQRLARLLGAPTRGDVIAGEVGEGARGVAVGKNIVQIGTLVIPTLPILALLGLALLGGGALALRARGPSQMPAGSFNVVVAEFGQQEAGGRVRDSRDAQLLSQLMFQGLEEELRDVDARSRVTVWHDSLGWTETSATIGIVAGATPDERTAAAAALAERLNAHVVIYGNIAAEGNPADFVPEFHVASLRGEADEVVGRHQLGRAIAIQLPIDMQDLVEATDLTEALQWRARALAWITRGLVYDLRGQPQRALEVFRQAESDPQLRDWTDREALHYFVGREALFWSHEPQQAAATIEAATAEAETAFAAAIALNPDYGRARIGMGSVHFARAQRLPPQERPESALLERAIAEYETALRLAAQQPGSPIALKARLGLGLSYRLRGETERFRQEFAAAEAHFEDAIQEITAVLDPLREAEDFRLLGQAFLALGTAHAQSGEIQEERGEGAASESSYEAARAAYAACQAQGRAAPYDRILTQTVVPLCDEYDRRADCALRALRGETLCTAAP